MNWRDLLIEAFNKPSSRNIRLGLSLLFIAIATMIIMTIFSVAKVLLNPDITIWETHIYTIIFTGLVAAVVALFVLLRFEGFYSKISEENEERKRAEDVLRENEEKFRDLLKTAPFAVFIYRGEKFCCYANPAAEVLTGFTKNELFDMNFWDFMHPDFKDLVKKRGMDRQMGKDVLPRYVTKIITKYGDERWIDLGTSKIMLGGKPAIMVTAIDITDRKKIEEAMEEGKMQVEVYIDLLSHDINNFNQVASGYIEMVLDKMRDNKKLDENDETLLFKSLTTLKSISILIDNIRRVRKVRSGELVPQLIDLGIVISEIIVVYENYPGRDVTIRYKPVTGYMVEACQLFKDAIANIVDNSIKHSIGPVQIDIGVDKVKEDGKNYYKISVEDNGPGIPDDRKTEIFKTREDEKTIKKHGLGMHLIRTLVEDFNGRVWVEDRVPGDYTKGTRFVVMIPAVKA